MHLSPDAYCREAGVAMADLNRAHLEQTATADLEFFPDQPRRWPKRPPKRFQRRKPPLTIPTILAWAKAHFERTGKFPMASSSGPVVDAAGENWQAIELALARGNRGLPGGTTLARLLAEHYGKRNIGRLPSFGVQQILAWADAYYARIGRWPQSTSGPVKEAPGETWMGIHIALEQGRRGLQRHGSLAQLLAKHRQVRNIRHLPRLTVKQILTWADDHFRRTGKWPTVWSGPIIAAGAQGETWLGINHTLQRGRRGLPGKCSLMQLLSKHRGKRNRSALPSLEIMQILAWADAHYGRTGRWPHCRSGAVHEAPGETWMGIENALRRGRRGLPPCGSLAQLLADHARRVGCCSGLTGPPGSPVRG
jgi:hypothetical protein